MFRSMLTNESAWGLYRFTFDAWLNRYMIITRLRIDLRFGNTLMYWFAINYDVGHLVMTSKWDLSVSFKRVNSMLPLPQPPAPFHLSYFTETRNGGSEGLNKLVLCRWWNDWNTIRAGGFFEIINTSINMVPDFWTSCLKHTFIN